MIGVVAPPLLTSRQNLNEPAIPIQVELQGTYRTRLMLGVVRTSSVAHVVTSQGGRVRRANRRRSWWCFIAAVTNLVYIVRGGVDVILCNRCTYLDENKIILAYKAQMYVCTPRRYHQETP